MNMRAEFAYVLLLLCVLPVPLFAQTITASLEGTVRDPSGAVITGAQVQVMNSATNVVTRVATDSAGRFLALSLAPGPYHVAVEAAGFKKLEQSGLVLQVNQSARVDWIMELGALAEAVEVTGRAPLLDASTSSVGQVVENRSIVNLPLNARNSYSLVFLTPGMIGSVGFGYNNVNISMNGGRPGSNAIMVDGIASTTPTANPIQGYTIFPSVDGVQEFKVQSSNYSAEFGRSGGGIINLIYKSGTNEFHGSAFEFLRNSRLDANGFFANRASTPLASFKRDQYGASVGGPVILPRLYNGRNRTFFFFDYEGLWQKSASTLLTTVPTALQRAGDFSETRNAAGARVLIYDPVTTAPSGTGFVRTPFPGNVIPAARFDAVAKNVVPYYAKPNQAGNPNTGINNFFLSGAAPVESRQFDAKVDQNVNDRNRFFVRVSRRTMNTGLAQYAYPAEIALAQGGTATNNAFFNGAANYTHNLSPTFLIEARYGFGRSALKTAPLSLGFSPVQLGMPKYMEQVPYLMFPAFGPSGYQTLGNGGGAQRGVAAFETHSMALNNMKVFAKHLVKFGFDWRVMRANNVASPDIDGRFVFDRSFTQGPNPNQASATAGDAMASFLLGLGTGSLTLYGKNSATQSPYYAWYLADDWKISRRLTLNIGLRYGLDVPYTERYNRVNIFDPYVASPLAGPAGLPGLKGGLVFLGTGGVGRRPIATDRNGWEPRFGFAYQLAKDTVLRGGYGIFHPPSLFAAGSTIGQTGYSSVTQFVSAADGITPATYLRDPFPGGLVPVPGSAQGLLTGIGTSISAQLGGDNVLAYTQNWTFNIQRQLPGSVVIEAGYVGSRGVHLNESNGTAYNLDQLTPAQMALGSQLQRQVANPFFGLITTGPLAARTVPYSSLVAPFPQFTDIEPAFNSGASSTYHSFQLKVDRRFGSGLTLLLSYTFDKLIDDYSITANVGANAGIQNIYDRRADRAVSANDVSQILVLSYVYQLPVGKGKRFGNGWNGILDTFLGGWQLNGIGTFQTGQPLALTTQNTSGSGSNVLRPNNNGTSAALSGPVESRLNRYFNTSVFSQPAAFTFGNTGRTLPDVRGPGIRNLDFSLFKNFRLIERLSLQFRAEAFNFLNTPRFGTPNTNWSAAQFGVISTQVNDPRQLQFGLKLLF
jgi:hypothetical protein